METKPPQPSQSKAVIQRKNVRELLQAQKSQIAMALPSHIDADRFIRVALTTINKQPKLMECTQESLLACLMDCSQLGLEPDSVAGLAYLTPFTDKDKGMICQLIVGYKGFVELAYRHPKVKSIRWHVVHQNDKFEYEEGLHPKLLFIPTNEEDEGPLTHAFAIADLDGGSTWVVLNRKEVMKAKACSRGATSKYSPWNTWEEAMWAKTAVRALAKQIPKSPELIRALSHDDEMTGALDVESQIVESKLIEQEKGSKSEEAKENPEVTQTNEDPLGD